MNYSTPTQTSSIIKAARAVLLILLIAFCAMVGHAQNPPPKLPPVFKVELTDKQVLKLDSAIKVNERNLINSNIPSNQVQALLAYIRAALTPIWIQVDEQVKALNAPPSPPARTNKKP